MIEFFQTPAGLALFSVSAAAIIIFILDVNYRIFAKRVLDFIFALLFTVILSPVLAVCSVISKVKCGVVYKKTACFGAGGKIVFVREYVGVNDIFKKLPRILDVLCGSISFVGTKLMPLADGTFMDDGDMGRFAAKSGIFCHLAFTGSAELTYEEMFKLDIRYARKRELFYDIFIVLKNLLLVFRGEYGAHLGETANKTYSEKLLERGTVTPEDIEKSEKYVSEILEEREKRRALIKNRWKHGKQSV